MGEKEEEEVLEDLARRNGATPCVDRAEILRIKEDAERKGREVYYKGMPFEVIVSYDPLSHSYQPYYRTLEIKPEPSSSF